MRNSLSIGNVIRDSTGIQTKCNRKGLLWRTQLYFSLLNHRTTHSNLSHRWLRTKTAPQPCIPQSHLPQIQAAQGLGCKAAAKGWLWSLWFLQAALWHWWVFLQLPNFPALVGLVVSLGLREICFLPCADLLHDMSRAKGQDTPLPCPCCH